ncbi:MULTISPECIES: hypothetical protein [unclassified Crossiella]|uniref:hypothetical protein n=1 Tax=unclassified Crossiella TaxID=2620835 RepID=UPI001FFED80B|nr:MULTISPECIES: hypothetical protein [unclassified Crossiella]MCK2242168.1 hypothetical protein [Crossiella sp. S99.2]MCK2256071.1 hypothetical protein [Crossiella sp. S99.1]
MNATPKAPPAWVPLARRILAASADNRHAEASRLMQELLNRYGSAAGLPALFAMIDAANTSAGHRAGQHPRQLMYLCADTGQLQTADQVNPAVRWAGRLMVARAANDRDQAEALINSVPSDNDKQWSDNVLAVINMCGQMVRGARGRAGGGESDSR